MASRNDGEESFTWSKVDARSGGGGGGSSRSLQSPGLLDIVFSWTIRDALNNKLYKSKVKQIPMTFSSPPDYLTSFKTPLVEETRSNLCAGLEALCANNNPSSSSCEISSIEFSKGFKPPKKLYYNISIKEKNRRGEDQAYEPEPGDIFAITQAITRCTGDLSKTDKVMPTPCNYLLAFVQRFVYDDSYNEVRVRASREIDVDRLYDGECQTLFATYLMNMTTNLRIWDALEYTKGMNLNIIGRVLKYPPSTSISQVSNDESICCHSLENINHVRGSGPSMMDRLNSLNLNESQRSAVLSIISMKNYNHKNDVLRLIWGPPGTGKTNTVASLLLLLLSSNRRTLACGPTNMAILQIAERLMKLLVKELKSGPYNDRPSSSDGRVGLGDVVLSGNKKRMTIMDDKDHELQDVFLDYRTDILAECLSPFTGLKHCLDSMVSFLEDPRKQYNTYLQQFRRGGRESGDCSMHANGECSKGGKGNWKSPKLKAKGVMKDNTKKENHNRGKGKKKEKITIKKEKITNYQKGVVSTEPGTSTESLSFEGYARKKYDSLEAKLLFCINGLYTHLPTSCISLHAVQEMVRVLGEIRLQGITSMKREECLGTLKTIPSFISDAKLNDMIKNDLPKLKDHDSVVKLMRGFCLDNARLIFCTASSSAKMHKHGKLDMVVIDEAAQLKECEAAIPLQLPGVCHAVLIGDDKQLPAMVHSKISENAEFGRSLFERLVLLGEKKLLLNAQYRMHPSISQFPNKEFYENQILNAPNVEEGSYERHLLPDKMYGSYSFINIDNGIEDFSQGHSLRNMMEVAVVDHILSRLFRGHVSSKQRVSVGVISPYKGQVSAIQEKLGKKYSSDNESNFCVSVRSVDGFQGGEEDVIIISTVRCNSKGSIGFLSNLKRTNVALTRARYCLWVLGNAATLVKSRSIWTELVIDAEKRRCYHDADEDKELHEVIFHTLIQTRQFHALLNSSFLQFDEARWKVSFTDTFWKSMGNIESTQTCKYVLCLLRQLAGGWRRGQQRMCSGSLVERYRVDDGKLFLIWSVDIHFVESSSKQVQVIKVWDVLPKSKIDRLIMTIQKLYCNYTVDTIQRCRYKSTQGDLVVPMSWRVKSIRSRNDSGSTDDSGQCMSTQFASLSLH